MQWCFGEILENKNHIELLEAELDTLEGSNLDLTQCHHEERRVREVHKTFGGWL